MAGVAVAAGAGLWLAIAGAGSLGGDLAPGSPSPVARPATIEPTMIGMNLGQSQYWGPEWVFADLVRNNGFLHMQNKDKLEGVSVDGAGRPVNVPKDTIGMMVGLQESPVWRSGDYDCTIAPGWTVSSMFRGTISNVKAEGFRLSVPKAERGYLVALAFRPKEEGVSLSKLSCLPVGLPAETVFNPPFLTDMKGFKVIRFMDWMLTNNQPFQTWANRPKPDDFSQLRNGMAVEYMVDLANTLGADPWFTLPFHAEPAYYRNFAVYVRDHLAPGRKAYVELSNEVWNDTFQQSKDAIQAGKQRYPGVEPYQAGDFYYADRVKEFMAVWNQVFAGQTRRLVRVAGGQIGWKERSDALLSHNDLDKSVDAYAVAPYFGHPIQDMSETGPARVTKVLDRLRGEAATVMNAMVAQKAVVEKHGVRFITYEGGPEVIGYNPEAGADAVAINHDPRMYDVYTNFLEEWRNRIGGLLVLYNGTSTTTYGHKDYTGQPLGETPKMRALVDFMARHPQ